MLYDVMRGGHRCDEEDGIQARWPPRSNMEKTCSAVATAAAIYGHSVVCERCVHAWACTPPLSLGICEDRTFKLVQNKRTRPRVAYDN